MRLNKEHKILYNKIKIAMKRILNYLNDLQLDQKTQAILNGELNMTALQQKTQEFQTLEQSDKLVYMSKLNERIKQITKSYQALSVLALVDSFMKKGLLICLPHMEFKEVEENMQVEEVILINIFKYYHYFLKMNNSSCYNRETLNEEDELNQAEYYCRINILKILQFFKIEFVFTHGWTRLIKHKLLLREIIQSILQRFAEDLEIITLFVKNNQDLLKQKTVTHPLMNEIYRVYQKLIFINKSFSKLEKIGRMAHCQQNFRSYQVQVESNKIIELNILQKASQKKIEEQSNKLINERQEEQCFQQQTVRTTESFLLSNSQAQQLI